MDINICPACGAVYKPRSKDCTRCGAVQSKFASTTVSTMASTVAPMVVSVAPDRLILERIVTGRQLNALVPATYFGADAYATDDFTSEFFDAYGSNGGSATHGGSDNGNNGQEVPQTNGRALPPSGFFDDPQTIVQTTASATAAAVAASGLAAVTGFFENQSQSRAAEAADKVDVFVPTPAEREDEAFDTANLKAYSANDQQSQANQDSPADEDIENFNFTPAPEESAEETPFMTEAQPNRAPESFEPLPTTAPNNEYATAPVEEPLAGESRQAQSAQGDFRPESPLPAPSIVSKPEPVQLQQAPAIDAHPEKPHRPQVAGPQELARSRADGEQSGYRAPTPATAEAFDFFQSSATPAVVSTKAAAKTAARNENSQSRALGDDPHSNFESLLSKSSKSGNYKPAETIEAEEEPVGKPQKSSGATAVKKARLVVDEDEDDDDDDDDDDRPRRKSSTRRGGKSTVIKKKSRDEDDDDVDDEDDEDEEREIPQRRSFSGSPSSVTNSRKADRSSKSSTSTALKSRSKRKNDDDDDDDDSSSSSSLRKKFNDGALFTVAGFPIGFKLVAITIAMMGMFAFAIMHIAGNFSALLGQAPQGQTGTAPASGGGLGGLITEAPKVSGRWSMMVLQNGNQYPNVIDLRQKGSELYGQGMDQKVGPYQLTGNVGIEQNVPIILLKKQFVDRNGRKSGPPIFFKGQLFLDTIPLSAAGQWEFKRVSARGQFGLKKQSAEMVRGEFQARLMRPIEPDTAGKIVALPGGIPGLGGGGGGAEGDKKFNIIEFFNHYGIFVVLGLGAAVIGGSFTLFGPSGLINIWNKQQYIPSQVKSQHNKIRSQLAKPLKKGSLPLGQRIEWKWWFPMPWVIKDLAIPPDMRKVNPHVLILGQGGKGKSRLVARMITHDIESEDRGIVLVDSDGSLVDLIVNWIAAHPRGREISKRVILIDPTYRNGSVAYNPLNLPDIGDLQTAAASIVDGFKAIYTEPPGSQSQWNAQTADILRNAILLLIGNGKTLIDLPTLLNENDFRDVLLENIEKKKNQRVEFATLLDQWGRYKKLARTDQWITWVEPILNRINPMLSNPRIRSILTKPQGDLDIMDIVTKKKILLVRIPQGDFGQDANLLGSLIVSGVKQACLTLSTTGKKAEHHPVSLYLDCFDNFIEKNTIEAITSETKKFKIGLIAVTKSLQHLPEDFRNQLIINIGTLITFALSKKDGDLLGPQMFPIDGRKVKHQTMSNIFNPVNTSPQFELVSDEEKLNIDKIVRQEERTFFCYRMGAEAGLFNLKSHPFEDVVEGKIKKKLIDKMHTASIRKADVSED
ncbi:MAG: hypothetical protein SFV17_02550 [Candidatus Obscuribacter sp.]|nr:hypothetical protein [Candidatus Obscuribacter sp.]